MSTLILTALSASLLPLLAVIAIVLRRRLIQGKMRLIVLALGMLLLLYVVIDNMLEHGGEFGLREFIVSGVVGGLTLFILSSFHHHHTHNAKEGGVKGIVISEAFHSLIDGAVIGATYLVNPVLGGAATLGIVTHEFPKVVGTLALFRGLNLSLSKTVMYGALAQGGAPVAALFVFILGKEVDHDGFHLLEIASLISLATIILWILYLEIRYHKNHPHHSHKTHNH